MDKKIPIDARDIAEILCQVNYSFCLTYDAPVKSVDWAYVPEEERRGRAEYILQFMKKLMGANNPGIPTPKEIHDEWVKNKKEDGWFLGEYDLERKLHPNLCEYEEMDIREQIKDYLFISGVVSFVSLAKKYNMSISLPE